MLSSDIAAALAEGKSARVLAAEFAQELMADPKLLKSELQGDGPMSRKPFCEFMGIGESTLTGWLQSDRIPQPAAVAYVLLLAAQQLQDQVAKLEKRQGEPRIIALAGKYAVVRFEESGDGESVGRIIASDIADLAEARKIALSQSDDLTRLLMRHLELLDEQIELTFQAGNDTAHWEAERASLEHLLNRHASLTDEKRRKPKA
jgi:DNA-binding transcriptional regulator YiaG